MMRRIADYVRDWVKANPHCWWALTLLYLIAVYIVPEHLVVDTYTNTAVPFDACIPFFAPAVTFYVLWFPLMFFFGLWLLFKDGRNFRRYMCALCICMTVSGAIYLLWPNGQDLRPDLSQPGNFFEWLLGGLYDIDTNTNVLPSLHVSCSMIVVFCTWMTPSIRRVRPKAILSLMSVLISASTVFVKQHAIIDLAAGAILGFLCAALAYLLFLPGKRRKIVT